MPVLYNRAPGAGLIETPNRASQTGMCVRTAVDTMVSVDCPLANADGRLHATSGGLYSPMTAKPKNCRRHLFGFWFVKPLVDDADHFYGSDDIRTDRRNTG